MQDERSQGFRTFTRAIDALEQAADPVILSLSARHEVRSLVPRDPQLPQSWREVRTLLEDPHQWYAGYLGVRDEYMPPAELTRDLGDRVPQASLRDTARYVYPVDYVPHEPMDLGLDPGGRRALAEGKTALVREPVPEIPTLLGDVIAEQERRRRFIREPWPTFHDDDAPRVYREMR